MRVPTRSVLPALAAAVLLAACEGREGRVARVAAAAPAPGASAGVAASFDPASWRAPADSEIPPDSLGASIRRGLALVRDTPDSLPAHAPGRIGCLNCHLDGGRSPAAAPLAGAHARYPKYMPRSGAVIGLADRVNYCFTRSLAGRRLPHESREMQDILAYLAFLSRGVPVGGGQQLAGADGLARIPGGEALAKALPGDSARGAAVYGARCASCHAADGAGHAANGARIPALWGPGSYSVGASMARQERAASFIWHNMPLAQGRSLTPQQAYDVAAFVNAHPRPDSPGKQDDWPGGGAPADVPYALRSGHAAFRPAPVLPRAGGAETQVPLPPRVARQER